MVGVSGFEPPASCSQSRRANQAALHPDIKKHSKFTKKHENSHYKKAILCAECILPYILKFSINEELLLACLLIYLVKKTCYRIPRIIGKLQSSFCTTFWTLVPLQRCSTIITEFTFACRFAACRTNCLFAFDFTIKYFGSLRFILYIL